MIAASSAAVLRLSPPPQSRSNLRSLKTLILNHQAIQRQSSTVICKATELAADAPLATAIAACVLNSVAFPATLDTCEDDIDVDDNDASLAIMGILSFIPYFNWLSWVFAWMDSGRRRYLVYSIVYLLPYFRTNFSVSPDESWLPIASIFICILHIQLEASIRNGDFGGLPIFTGILKKGMRKRKMEQEFKHGFQQNIRSWGIPKKPVDELHHQNEKSDVDARDKSD